MILSPSLVHPCPKFHALVVRWIRIAVCLKGIQRKFWECREWAISPWYPGDYAINDYLNEENSPCWAIAGIFWKWFGADFVLELLHDFQHLSYHQSNGISGTISSISGFPFHPFHNVQVQFLLETGAISRFTTAVQQSWIRKRATSPEGRPSAGQQANCALRCREFGKDRRNASSTPDTSQHIDIGAGQVSWYSSSKRKKGSCSDQAQFVYANRFETIWSLRLRFSLSSDSRPAHRLENRIKLPQPLPQLHDKERVFLGALLVP